MISPPTTSPRPAGRESHREGSPMTRRRPRSAALRPLERGFETSRHSATYLMIAFERASPTLERRIRPPREHYPRNIDSNFSKNDHMNVFLKVAVMPDLATRVALYARVSSDRQ